MKYILLTLLSMVAVGSLAQVPAAPTEMSALGTRSWIKVTWKDNAINETGYKLYWSENRKKPTQPGITLAPNACSYYIEDLKPGKNYHIWLEVFNGQGSGKCLSVRGTTATLWKLEATELAELKIVPSSAAVPKGMQLYWHDEFNDLLLNRNKWTTNYFSSLNYMDMESKKEMLANTLLQPAYMLNGKTINLFVNDTIPDRLFTKKGNQKVSSIQTYDWRTNENLLDNSKGGYFEVKVKRSSSGKPKGLNTAFWFDSPGPDLRYYLEQGTELDGIQGIRPKGQVFEIDIFEYLTAQFVLHGHVDEKGKFLHNIATHIAEGYDHINQWVTHGVLWTPTSIKHYINGNLIKEYTDKNKIFSPNHFMSVFLGTYGSEGNVNMEVDYIRAYNWPVSKGNELPNPGFEDSGSLIPWEGNGELAIGAGVKGSTGLRLQPGQKVEQYLYLDNDAHYMLDYWVRGKGMLRVNVFDVAMVSGELSNLVKSQRSVVGRFTKKSIRFKSGKEHGKNKKTVKIVFENTGTSTVILDEVRIKYQSE
ncbi:hypothetical protein CPT03_13345 [Pedobacter ginsengisoli]|uniref:GH16 domain-containing protein n=2 Tax=Pedobacter ginsengisoli TaxID=363852 RepID=A0A2D1UC96_9SPHI|nr:hypothetical protein CPT03_13345 [Pedobacter ginsengisoli]